MLAPMGTDDRPAPTSVALFDQGLTQIMQASVTGLAANHSLCWHLLHSLTALGR